MWRSISNTRERGNMQSSLQTLSSGRRTLWSLSRKRKQDDGLAMTACGPKETSAMRSSGRLGSACRQRAAHRIGLPSNDFEVRLRRLIRSAAVLLPIAQRPEWDAKGIGELDLRHAKTPANAFGRRNPTNWSKAAGLTVLDRRRGGIGPGLGQNLIVRLGAQSSPLLGRHPVCFLIDPHAATARLLRCSRSAHGHPIRIRRRASYTGMPYGVKSRKPTAGFQRLLRR
jgi:hypothetical protein